MSHLRLLLVILSVLMLVACSSVASSNIDEDSESMPNSPMQEPAVPPHWPTHVDAERHFRFRHPPAWKVMRPYHRFVMHYLDVFATLNSAGREGLLVAAKETAPNRWELNPGIIGDLLPPGCIYMDIGWWEGGWERWGPGIKEMTGRDVIHLLAETAEKPTSDKRVTFRGLRFHKWGRRWQIRVYYRKPVAERDRLQMEEVLKSLLLDAIPVGDEIWAIGEARKHLPPEAEPDDFRREGGNYLAHVRSKRVGDEVVVTFTRKESKTDAAERAWRFRVTATGEVVPTEIPKLTTSVRQFSLPARLSWDKDGNAFFREEDAVNVDLSVTDGFFVGARVIDRNTGRPVARLAGPPLPDDANAIARGKSLLIEVFESSEPPHMWRPGVGPEDFRILWEKTFDSGSSDSGVNGD